MPPLDIPTAVAPTSNGKEKKSKKPVDLRPVLYPEIEVCGIKIPRDRLKITVARMKEILGWEEETDAVKFGQDYDLVDLFGKKIRLTNNKGNRPWTEGWSLTLAQDILNGHWKFNGESAIVGKYGTVLSLQHRGMALIFAYQLWSGAKGDAEGKRWKKNHPEEPFLETLLVTGIEEDGATTRTLDNVKPRDFSDVLYSDPTFFGDRPPTDRKALCRAVAYAVKELWVRTGMDKDAYSPKRTHSSSLAFLSHHSKIKDACLHLHEENADNKVGKLFSSVGYSAATLYLQAASGTDDGKGEEYRASKVRDERHLDLSRYDRACEFWVGLVGASPDFQPVWDALADLGDKERGIEGSRKEKSLVIQRAWNQFANGEKFNTESLTLGKSDYSIPDDDGVRYQIEFADYGGIDLGEGEPAELSADPVDPEEVEAAKEEVRKENGHAPVIDKTPKGQGPKVAKEKTTKPNLAEEAATILATRAAKKAETMEDRLRKLREKHPDTLFLFQNGNWYTAWMKDGTAVANLMKTKANSDGGLVRMDFTSKDYPHVIKLLHADGRSVAIVEGETVKSVEKETAKEKVG